MSDFLHLACPHCQAVNRVPQPRLNQHPSCGRCHQPLFDGHPVALNTTSFTSHLSRNDIPLLVDFWAPWCGPCKMMAPAFARAATLLEPQIRLAKVNTEIEQTLASRYAIRSIPTMVLFAGGQEIARQSGAMGTPEIVHWVQHHLR